MILVAGEVLVDLIVRPESTESHLGGGPFNTARALQRLGVSTAFFGRVSSDVFGKRVTAELEKDHVSLKAVVPTDDLTTMALVEINERGGASYRFYLEATSVPGCTIDDAKAVLSRVTDAADPIVAIHVGTLALVLEPFANAVEYVVEQMATNPDVLIAVDPNIRAIAIHDRDAYLARLHRVLTFAHVVKVSDEDLRWIDPSAVENLEGAARALLTGKMQVVLVTQGGDGVLVITESGTEFVPTPKVPVADTIGAGDTFTAGVLSWWIDNGRPSLGDAANAKAATQRGCAAAAYVVQQVGANPPHRSDLGLD
jgi:fructokinase